MAPLSCRAAALRLLDQRGYSVSRLTDKLLGKGYAADEVEREVADFIELGFLDDAAYAANVARSFARSRGLGPRRLAFELTRRGIDRDLAAQAAAEISANDYADGLQKVVARYLNHSGDPIKNKQRMLAAIAQRGHSAAAALNLWNQRPVD